MQRPGLLFRARTFLPTLAVVLCGAAGVGLVTVRYGVGVWPDSVQFLTAAQRWSEFGRLEVLGRSGDFVPLSQFPPLYPLMLSWLSDLSNQTTWRAAWFLHVGLTALNLVLVAMLARHVGDGSLWAGFWAAAWCVVALPFVKIHTQVMSEPLFLSLTFSALLALGRYGDRPSWPAWTCAAACVALACLTRYAGIALIVAGTLGLLLCCSGPLSGLRVRLARVLLFCGLVTAPLLGWLFAARSDATSIAGRVFAAHAPILQDKLVLCATVSGWLLPLDLPVELLNILSGSAPLVAVIVLLLIAWRRTETKTSPGGRALPAVSSWRTFLFLFVACYLVVIVVVRWFFDAALAFDERMLLPVQTVVIASAAGWICSRWRFWNSQVRRVLLVVSLLLMAGHLVRTALWAGSVAREGQGFNTESWRSSLVWRELGRLDEDSVICSNAPDAVYFWVARPARMLPIRVDPVSLLPNDRFEMEIEDLIASVERKRTVVVLFDDVGWRWYLPEGDEWAAILTSCRTWRVGSAVFFGQ